MSCDVGEQSSFSKLSVASPTSQLIFQPFCCFTYVTAHSLTFLLLLLSHRIFTYVTWRAAHSNNIEKCNFRKEVHIQVYNTSVASPTSQLILQPFRCSTYVTAHVLTLPLRHLRHSSFYNPSLASPTSQLILQPFPCFTYVTAHSPTLPLLHLRHSSFSNTSVASHTSQLILQPFRCFTYFTSTSPTPPGEPPNVEAYLLGNNR